MANVPAVDSESSPLRWLRQTCSRYELDVVAVYRRSTSASYPIEASTDEELEAELAARGQLTALPKEPATLANVLEVSIVDYLVAEANGCTGASAARGTERGYPDIELSGPLFGSRYHAVDVKVARRAKAGTRTQSRITLYTGNTYFRYPTLRWPGMFRSFEDYEHHLDVIVLYTLDEHRLSRATDVEIIVQPAWKIASRQRSSTTREYIGAVTTIAGLRDGRGEFETEAEFYRFWRTFPFRTGRAVEQQLQRLLAAEPRRP